MAATLVDLVHAIVMAVWVLGLPLLFYRRWPGATRLYGIYAVVFVVGTRVSHWVLDECVLTTLARHVSVLGTAASSDEWFTVRFVQLVFGMTPPHRLIAWVSEGLVLATALGVLWTVRRESAPRKACAPPSMQRVDCAGE